MRSFAIYVAAALAEIAGCFAFWAWLRLDRSVLWVLPGVVSLVLFAFLLTLVNVDAFFAGRAYAAYGGVYIAAALAWIWVVEGWMLEVEGAGPDRWDLIGGAIALVGAGIILFGPRAA